MDFSFLTPVVLCILITEAVERFAFYGFRAVLVLYFIKSLNFSEETAIALFAFVSCLAYASPLLGAYLADGYIGRYKTILCFGWVYALGLGVLTLAAYTEQNLELRRSLSFAGLFLFCMGTGGIKPCVSAFGADQVMAMDSNSTENEFSSNRPSSSERVRAFFGSFYFCINLGAVSSIAVIPIVKHRLGFGAAFLLPTIFIVMAMLVFLSKRRDYVHQVPGQDGSLGKTFALSFWIARKELGRNRWISRTCPCMIPKRSPIGVIDNEDDDTPASQQLTDARRALRVMPIMCMFPMFWMLYDQHSSVWTIQASRMQLYGLEPEQLVVVNPIEIMIFIPLFDRIIYPSLEACGWSVSHLSRMRWGMFLTAVSFSLSGLLETWIQVSHENSISVFWQLPQITLLTISEIFVSVTGLEFAYSMAPERLKAFIMGIYLVMTAVGNLFGGVLYSSVFQQLNRATVMHVCAALMLCNLALFCWVGQGWEKRKDDYAADDVELSSSRGLGDPLKDPPRTTINVLLFATACHAAEQSSSSSTLSTAFLNACTEGNLEEIEAALVDHPEWVNGRSESGETCLHVAGIKGQSEVSQLILKLGGDANIRSTYSGGLRMHPLSWNVYGGHVENARVLLEVGQADVNSDYDDSKGSPITVMDTILQIVPDNSERDDPSMERFYKMKELLLEHGAKRYKDLHAEDKEL